MTRPPPPRRHTGPALATCLVLATAALGFIVGHGNSAAAVRGVARVPVVAPSTNPLRADLSPSDSRTINVVTTATVERTRTLRAVTTATVTAAPRTVFATQTATATVTAEHTVTATATQTVTATATTTETAVPTPSVGVAP